MPDTVAPEEVLAQIDPLYFLDYAIFTGSVRHYASRTLEEAFKADPNPIRRRLHLVNLVKEEYAAYEDVGALINAFLDFREGKFAVPIVSLMAFKARDVELAKIFEDHKITSREGLFTTLGLEEWIPVAWGDWFSHLDLQKALRLACQFFYNDCTRNQKRYGVVAYNKIKHGLLVVPSGQRYKASLPDSPAALFATDAKLAKSGAMPYTIYGFKLGDDQIEERHKAVEFVQSNLRLFAGLYVVWRYPGALGARGIAGPKEMFESAEFYDVRHLIGEVTAKK